MNPKYKNIQGKGCDGSWACTNGGLSPSIFPLDIFSMSTRFSKQLSNKLGVIDQKSNKLGVFFNLFAYVPIK